MSDIAQCEAVQPSMVKVTVTVVVEDIQQNTPVAAHVHIEIPPPSPRHLYSVHIQYTIAGTHMCT